MPVLSDYRVYRFDTRGHGDTDAPEGPYDLDMLADDAKGLLDAWASTRCISLASRWAA